MGSLQLSDDHLRRQAEHEDEDYERTVRRLLDQEFDDWPNEAGVGIVNHPGLARKRVANALASLRV